MIHSYKIDFDEFISLFNCYKNIVDTIDEAIYEDISADFDYNFKNYDWEIAHDIVDSHVNNIKDIHLYILDEIESFFNDQVDDYFDDPIKMRITGFNHTDSIVYFTIETEDLETKIGMGMNAYGEWDWHLHAPEDKEMFVNDAHLMLREILHYYEACHAKPKINFSASIDSFWKYDMSIEAMEELINEAQSKLD
jgi:hypothetical protein